MRAVNIWTGKIAAFRQFPSRETTLIFKQIRLLKTLRFLIFCRWFMTNSDSTWDLHIFLQFPRDSGCNMQSREMHWQTAKELSVWSWEVLMQMSALSRNTDGFISKRQFQRERLIHLAVIFGSTYCWKFNARGCDLFIRFVDASKILIKWI